MVQKLIPSIAICLTMLFSGCIKDELPNIECDIEDVAVIPNNSLKTSPIIKENTINILVKKNAVDLSKDISLVFIPSPGATIEPLNTKLDYTRPQTFTVTSQDGVYSKKYTVNILEISLPKQFDFENWELIQYKAGAYYNAYEIIETENASFKFNIWSSGNAGYALVASDQPESYPTRFTGDSRSGRALCVETKSAAPSFGMPIAAGNLFIGTFDGSKAMKAPMEATRFGLPFEEAPEKMSFWYKYEPKLIEKENIMDQCDIYGVFFDNNNGTLTLDGNTVLTHDNIVALARIDDHTATPAGAGYIEKELTFDYRKPIDEEKLKNSGYSFSLVFTSSSRGDKFIGAPGSKLYVDEVRVVCKP